MGIDAGSLHDFAGVDGEVDAAVTGVISDDDASTAALAEIGRETGCGA